MRTAFVRVDGVGERVDTFVVVAVPLHRDFQADALVGVFSCVLDDVLVHHAGLAAPVDVTDEVGDPTFVVVA